MTTNYKEKFDSLQKAIAELRGINEEKLESKDKDPLWDVQLEKVNQEIDKIENLIKSLRLTNENSELSSDLSTGQLETKSLKSSSLIRKKINDYIRKGVGIIGEAGENGEARLQISSMKGEGRYNATYSIADSIYKYLQDYSVFRKLCSTILVSRDALDMPMSVGDIASEWADGSNIAPPSDSMIMNSIRTFELTAQPQVTQKMIDDTAIDLESWLVEKLSALFLLKEDEAFIKGDGNKSPRGILSYPEPDGSNVGIERIKSANPDDFTEEDLLNLYYSLPDYYSINGAFIMNKATVQKIRTFKDPNSGQYYWMPGILFGKTDTLLGMPLFTSGHVPITENGKDVVIYGDMKKAYQIVDRSEITIQRDPYSSKPFVVFYATKRVGGDIIDPEAVKLLRIS